MTFYLSRLYCDTCIPRAFKLHECGACFHDTCDKKDDPTLSVHVCPQCKGPVRFAQLTAEQVTTFQAVCDAEGDVMEAIIRGQIIKNRKNAEACLNHIWNKTDHRYPLMMLTLQNIIEELEKMNR